jgi:hypothetical protein
MIKICVCGEKMSCTDTRNNGPSIRRRYACSCGLKKTTLETEVKAGSGNGKMKMEKGDFRIPVLNILKHAINEINSIGKE